MTDTLLIWSYLKHSPLLWLTLTLAAYAVGEGLFQAARGQSIVNPVLIAVILLGGLLGLSGTSYATYFEGAQFVHFMLGPATVALAVPLVENLAAIRRALLPITVAMLTATTVGIGATLLMGQWFGLGPQLLASLVPKSTTSPVAIGVAEALGGLPTLTAAIVIVTGIFGAVIASPFLRLIGLRDARAVGLTIGTSAGGIGTARAFQIGTVEGSFASIGMGLATIAVSVLAPILMRLMG